MTRPTTRLGPHIRIRAGVAPADLTFHPSGLYPYIKVEELNIDGRFIEVAREYTNQETRQLIPAGTLILPKRGAAIATNKLKINAGPCYIDSNLMSIQPMEGLDRDYLLYWLLCKELFRIADMSTIPQLNNKHIEPLPIHIPSHSEQRRIVDTLEAWDCAIETDKTLLITLERRKQGLMQQLLTGRRRLKGFKGKWKLLRADKLFTEISTRNQTADEQLLSVTQDRGVIPRDMLVGRVTMPTGAVDAFKLVESDNFVISLRSFQGGLEHSAYRGLVSPAYTVLQASDDIHPAFFRHYFKSTDFVKRLSVAVVGIRDGKQISYTDFRSIKLPLPPVNEQIALNELLDLADRDIALCRARLDSLQLQKRALMQKLLSGEWRLPEKLVSGKYLRKKDL